MQVNFSSLILALVLTWSLPVLAKSYQPYEVWLVDQADTKIGYGGKIHIYSDSHFQGMPSKLESTEEIIDLGAETAELCLKQTGFRPVRPHMIHFTRNHTYAALAFVASGHVVIFDASTRQPLQCLIASTGDKGAKQAHTAVPAPNQRWILVANQNGKMLERIDTDYATGSFVWNHKAAIDLTRCQTPDGSPCQDSILRPDNAPICVGFDSSSSLAVVTLRGGGLLVVDPRNTPMTILQAFDASEVQGNGCGGVQARDAFYINSGGATASTLYGFNVYRLPLAPYFAGKQIQPSGIEMILSMEDQILEGSDAHGMAVVGDEDYLWVIDRHRDVIEVIDLQDNHHVHTIGLLGELSAKTTADLIEVEPNGRFAFLSLRGSMPLSGDPHVSTGASPGLMVMEILDGGGSGEVKMLRAVSNFSLSDENRADPHGLAVRMIR